MPRYTLNKTSRRAASTSHSSLTSTRKILSQKSGPVQKAKPRPNLNFLSTEMATILLPVVMIGLVSQLPMAAAESTLRGALTNATEVAAEATHSATSLLIQHPGILGNTVFNAVGLMLGLIPYAKLHWTASPEAASTATKALASYGKNFFTLAVGGNWIRDYIWPGGVFLAINGLKQILDIWHPIGPSATDNWDICLDSAAYSLLLFAGAMVYRYRHPQTSDQSLKKIAASTFYETLTVALAFSGGLFAWNSPGWMATPAEQNHLGDLTLRNGLWYSWAYGLWEGCAQVLIGTLMKAILDVYSGEGLSADLLRHFLVKLSLGWFAGAAWNVSYIAQDMGPASGGINGRGAFILAAANLATTVAIGNAAVGLWHNYLDSDRPSFKTFLDQEWPSAPQNALDNAGEGDYNVLEDADAPPLERGSRSTPARLAGTSASILVALAGALVFPKHDIPGKLMLAGGVSTAVGITLYEHCSTRAFQTIQADTQLTAQLEMADGHRALS